MPPRYNFQRLPPGRYFRLLRISPDHNGDVAPQLDLVQYALDDCPSYRTMSYVWGNPERSEHCIMIGGKVLGITENLSRALPNIFRQCHEGFLWCDQICIDQDDVDERGAQVSLMADIYRKALGVVIWLDLEDAVADELYDWINALGLHDRGFCWDEIGSIDMESATSQSELPQELEDILAKELHQRSLHNNRNWSDAATFTVEGSDVECDEGTKIQDVVLSPGWVSLKRALNSFLNAAWLTRVWIVQEALLSREVTVALGIRYCSLQSLARLVLAAEYGVRAESRDSPNDTPGLGVLLFLMDWHIISDSGFARSLYGFLCNLRTLAIRGKLKASDPRDMVHGLLALTNNPEPYDLVPDYSLPVEIVYINTARAIIAERNDLQILLICDGVDSDERSWQEADHSMRSLERSLPTWVPDWSRGLARYTIFPGQMIITPFCSTVKLATRVQELYTRGRVIDAITCPMPGVYKALKQWLRCILHQEGVGHPREERLVSYNDPVLRHAYLRGLLESMPTGVTQPNDTEIFKACVLWSLTDPGTRLRALVELRSRLRDPLEKIMSAFGELSSAYSSMSSEDQPIDLDDEDGWSDTDISAGTCEHAIGLLYFCASEDCRWGKLRLLRWAMYSLLETLAITTSGKVVLTQDNVQPHDVVAVLRGFPAPVILRMTDSGQYQYVSVCSHEDAFEGPSLRDWPEDQDEHIILV